MLAKPQHNLTRNLYGYLRTSCISMDLRRTLHWGCLLVISPFGVPPGQCLACGRLAVRTVFVQDGKLEPFRRLRWIVSPIFVRYTRLWIGVTTFLRTRKSRSLMPGSIALHNHRVQ